MASSASETSGILLHWVRLFLIIFIVLFSFSFLDLKGKGFLVLYGYITSSVLASLLHPIVYSLMHGLIRIIPHSGFVSPTVTVPLGSISLVSNVFFARWLLGELITNPMLVSTFIIILGAVLTTVFSAAPSDVSYSRKQAEALFRKPVYLVYVSVVSILIVATFSWFQLQFRRLKAQSERGIVEGFDSLSPTQRFLTRFSVPCFGGLVGSQTVLFTKVSVELLKYSFKEGENQYNHALSWFFLFMAGFTAVIQIHYLNVSLRSFGISYVVPIYYVVWTVASIIGAGVLFGDFKDFEAVNYGLFSTGLVCVLSGVTLLSFFSPNILAEDDVREKEIERKNEGLPSVAGGSAEVLMNEDFSSPSV